jgi:EAL domain-containing protein (putative c-di-GMP-specific phosphodiesterase class I)/DNA-binding NarL/FixJ family response regulator
MAETSIRKAIIIDDSGDYRSLLTMIFKKASPGSEIDEYDPAWGKPPDTFPWARYDLLILDYDLGSGENGLDWLRQYKTSNDFPPTIMLTAKDDEELVVNAMLFGAQGFLRKVGLAEDKLKETIHDALEKYKEEQEMASSQKIHVHDYNKEKFFESLESVKKNDAVFLIEIDKYQALSESLGIFATDHFTSFFSESVSNFITESDYDGQITRIGDSKVAMLIQNNKDKDEVESIAKKLCEYFDRLEYKNEANKVDFSSNIGVLCIEEKIIATSDILAAIEKVCRQSRDNEGNTYTIRSSVTSDEPPAKESTAAEPASDEPPAMESTATEPASDEPEIDEQEIKRITDALKEDRMRPLFQPLVLVSDAVATASTEFYHARINLLDSDKNIIEAKEFIPILRKEKKLKTLDRWVIRHCVGELSKLNKEETEKFGVLITLSEQSLVDKTLSDWILKLVEYVNMPKLCSSIIFEIVTEDFIKHQRDAKLQINKMRVKLGATFALRDIRNAATADECLNHEKFEYVMFSPEHTADKKMDHKDILELTTKAKEHGALTVASKIDSGEYLGMAAGAGVDYVFGHFVQPPMENIVAAETVEV